MASPVDSARQGTNKTTATASQAINVGSPVAGTLLVVFIRWTEAVTAVTFTGYTALVSPNSSDAANDITALYYRWADGTEGATDDCTWTTNSKLAAICWEITGAEDPAVTAPTTSTVVNYTTGANAANPTAVTVPGGVVKDYLFLAIMANDGEAVPTVVPTNYSNLTTANSGTTGTADLNCVMAGGSRQLTTGTDENPSNFTHGAANAGGQAYAVIIHPPPTPVPQIVPVMARGTGAVYR